VLGRDGAFGNDGKYTVSTRMLHGSRGCAFGTMGPIAKDVAAGSVLSHTLYFPYGCHGTLTIDVGYTQQRRPSQMPFDIGGFGNAKVGRAVAKLPYASLQATGATR
jgi:hypothetical protein